MLGGGVTDDSVIHSSTSTAVKNECVKCRTLREVSEKVVMEGTRQARIGTGNEVWQARWCYEWWSVRINQIVAMKREVCMPGSDRL